MMKFVLLYFLTITISWSSWAADDDLKIEYSIRSQSADVEIKTPKTQELVKTSKTYLFSKVQKALLKSPYIVGIQFTKGPEVETENKWADYIEVKRTSKAYINLALPAKVSMLVEVEEEMRKCKNLAGNASASSSSSPHDYYDPFTGSSSSSGCTDQDMRSELKIKGPLAVYGTFASHINPNRLLKDKQELEWTLTPIYDDDKSIKLKSSFDIKSSSFEKGLYKFLEVFNVSLTNTTQMSLSGASIANNITRKQILVEVARALKSVNEEIVGLCKI